MITGYRSNRGPRLSPPAMAVVILCQALSTSVFAEPTEPCKIVVVERDSGWPVPLVELRTLHQLRFVSDNAGVIAIDDPSLMHREVWFQVLGQGYEVPADGFGFRGVRLTPQPGATSRIEVMRTSIARRLGRLTGGGLFAESQKLGEQLQWTDGPALGCDSVQLASHRGRAVWAWGDTTLAHYPLGVFHMTGASTSLAAFDRLEPPIKPPFEFFLDSKLQARGLAIMPGTGPTWLTGFFSLPDARGESHLVALYRKIKSPPSVYEIGQCVWDDQQQAFQHRQTLWQAGQEATDTADPPAILSEGHPIQWQDGQGKQWLSFGNPFPHVKLPATFEAWCDTSQWQALAPPTELESSQGTVIEPHSGSVAYNSFRRRWVTVFVQKFGRTSFLGNVWYAEADAPTGPWGPAVEILAHDNYSFYNPRLHPELESGDQRVLLFEGTFTATFAQQPLPTPRWDYNQVLYRLDLDDPSLQAAQEDSEVPSRED